ncbi:MAG: hypothetical protein RMJ44_01455 [Cytophagales bacterium]|nr:hypothetical protein [Cytophagales bacterium]
MKTINVTPEMYPIIIKAYERKKAKLMEQVKALQNEIKKIEAEINEMTNELRKKKETSRREKKRSDTVAKRKSGYLKMDYEGLVQKVLQEASGNPLQVPDIQRKIMEMQGLNEEYAQKVGSNVYRVILQMKKENKVTAHKLEGSRKIAYSLVQ